MDWISLKERKPENDQAVLVWWPNAEDDHQVLKARFCRPDKRRKGFFDTFEFEDECLILANQEVTLPTGCPSRQVRGSNASPP